jgi:hypothetical protein
LEGADGDTGGGGGVCATGADAGDAEAGAGDDYAPAEGKVDGVEFDVGVEAAFEALDQTCTQKGLLVVEQEEEAANKKGHADHDSGDSEDCRAATAQ